MPASIFSETELARLASFPEEIPGDDLIRAFTLTGADRDLGENRYGTLRKFAPLVLRVLDAQEPEDRRPPNRCSRDSERAESQATTAGSRGRGTREFASAKWRGQLLGSDGRVNRRSFELCVLYQLRDGLRSGAIWLQGSRRFADPARYLIPSSQWTSRRSEVLRILGLEQEPREHLEARRWGSISKFGSGAPRFTRRSWPRPATSASRRWPTSPI